MTWTGFDRRAYTRAEFAAHVAELAPRMGWARGITLHNTGAPTLKQWAESGPAHDARIDNLQRYYELPDPSTGKVAWHAGPHSFISRNFINGFSDLLKPGVHSRCFNATHIGVEMVGDYATEEFDSGDGALVRDNAVFAMATLCKALNLDPKFLTFHKDCTRDNHDCPGRKVNKADVINRVLAEMGKPVIAAAPVKDWKWSQEKLKAAGFYGAAVDGDPGPQTEKAVAAFITANP